MKKMFLTVAFLSITCLAENIEFRTTEELGVKVRPERLTPDESEIWRRLDNLAFKPSLSQDEVEVVIKALKIPKNLIIERALLLIVVHDIPVQFPSDAELESRRWGGDKIKIIKDAREREQSPVDFLKRNNNGDMFINETLGRIAAVYFAREMRQGRDVQFNENEYAFLRYDKLLVEYAKYPESEIPQIIYSELAKATVGGTREYNLADVLLTYDDINLDLLLSTLIKDDISKYGKIVLLYVLHRRLNSFGDADQEKIKSALIDFEYERVWNKWLADFLGHEIPPYTSQPFIMPSESTTINDEPRTVTELESVTEEEFEQPNSTIFDAPPPSRPNPPASHAWLWLLALPVVAGVWLVVRLRKKT